MSELIDSLNQAAFEDSEVLAEKDYTKGGNASAANMFSEDWTKYVMQLFSDDELDNGHPKCEGLRRVVNLLVGPILDSNILNNEPPKLDNFGNATVAVRIRVRVKNEDHPLCGEIITQDAITDVNSRNTPAPFHLHPSASSFTRSESSAFRKILHLQSIVSAEELAPEGADESPIWEPDEVIGDEQIMAMDSIARRCNISLLEYINSGSSGQKYNFIEQIPKATALSMIKHLNKIQQAKATRPKTVGNYEKDWRVENNRRRGIET